MNTSSKIEVFNSITLLNSVGQEVACILDAQGKDKTKFLETMQWADFESVTKLKIAELKLIKDYLSLDCDIVSYLKEFQKNYSEKSKLALIDYKESKREYKRLKVILPLLKDEFNKGLDILDDLLDYFDCDDLSEIENNKTYSTLFKENNHFSYDTLNVYAWLRRGELDYRKEATFIQYNKDLLLEWINNKEWETNLKNIDYFLNLPFLFKSFGVCLSYTPYLPKTVYGAVQWIDKTPIIQVSDNNKDLATGWMTLFHEIGHIVLHENISLIDAGEEADKKISNKKRKQMEVEANQFASDYLCKGNYLRTYIFDLKRNNKYETLSSISRKFGVNNLFTAYWFRKAQYNPTHCKDEVIRLSFT